MGLSLTVVMVVAGVTGLGAYVYWRKPELVIKGSERFSRGRKGVQVRRKRDRDGTMYRYIERGCPKEGTPSLVLLHGIGTTAEIWLDVIGYVPADVHVIAVDLPGHGGTAVTSGVVITAESMMEQIYKLIHDIVPVNGPFHMTGQSLGGIVAAAYTAKYPQDVANITLICPGMRTPILSDMMQKLQEDPSYNPFVSETKEVFYETISLCLSMRPNIPDFILRGLVNLDRPHHDDWNKLSISLREELSSTNGDAKIADIVRSIKSPSQIIWGDNDLVVHVSGAKLLESLLPNCVQVDIFKGIGHSLNMLVPKDMSDKLVDFRAKCAPAVS